MNVQAATATYNCKFPNCTNEASSRLGRYSYCKIHQSVPKTKGAKAASDSIAGRLGALQAQARKVDALRAKAEKLTRQALAAKRAADEEQEWFAKALAELSGMGNGTTRG